MGWHRRALLATLLLAAIVHAQKQTNSGADPAAAQPSGGTKSRRPPKSKADAAADTSPEPSTSKSSSSSSKNSSGSGSNSSSGAETATESSSRKSRRKNSTTEATPTETSTEPSSGKSRRNRKNRTTEAPTPEPTTPSSSRKNRRKNATTVVPPEATTRCNRACRRRLKAERRRATSTTAAPTTTTSTTTTTTTPPPPPPPTPVPLDAATVAYLISSNPALHVINERILLSAAYAYSDDNEVVCNFCLLQLLAAGHTMGNDLVRREIETALQSREPGRLGEALLQLVSGAPTLSGTFAALYQKDALPKCHSQPAWRRNERCYAIERFINLRGTKVDFTQPGTTSLINSLIERASGNMITELFPPLAASSQLVFASVLVFRDTWKQRLYWQPGSFTTFYGNLSAETLIQQEYVPLLDGSSDGVIGVSLPYSQPGMRMMLFTTSDGGSVVERLRTVHYRALAGAPLTYSTVFFPRFSVWSNKYSYADLAQQMGISELFRGGLGLGDRLRMELFVQRAVVSADVDGSDSLTAAAEPVWDGAQHPTPVQVVFDRPFVCSLVHAELDVPFFTAIIRDPTRFY